MGARKISLCLLWYIVVAVVALVVCEETNPDSHGKSQDAPEKNSKFAFRIELYTKCSALCGGGTQIAIFVCYNKTSSLAVRPSHCRHLTPPGQYRRVCNMRPCPYRWDTGLWSPCSRSCGRGTKRRKIKCVDRNNAKVSAWKCARMKIPEKNRKCGVADCKPEFEVGPWSKCSSTCGFGTKGRSVYCKQILANGTVFTLPYSRCDGMSPAKVVKCKDTECSHESSGHGYDIQGEEPLDQEGDFDASDASAVGSGDGGGLGKPEGKDPPVIKLSKQPKQIFRRKEEITVLVGTKVWAPKGSKVKVSCTATGKYPATITWTRDGYEITKYFEDDVGFVDGKLEIRKTRRFNEGTFVCTARSKGGTSRATFVNKVFDPNQPFIFMEESSKSFGPGQEKVEVIVGGSVTLYTGSSLTIKCPASGNPTPRVYWLSQGRPIAVGKAKMVGNNLIIDRIDKIYSLDYTCHVRNLRGKAKATTTVNVLDLSPPKIEAHIKVIDTPISKRKVLITIGTNLTVVSGTSLMINCPISSKPTPFVSWMAKGKSVAARGNRIAVSRDKSSIILNKMSIGDTGLYSCMAKNAAGKDTKSSYVKIVAPQLPTIQSKTGFRSSMEKDQAMKVTIGEQATALAGITLTIVCPVKGLPTPMISWQINRRAVTRRSHLYVVNRNTLIIKRLSRTENGNVACTARNQVGRATSSSKVNVIAGLKPQIQSKSGRVIGDGSQEETSITIGQDLRIVQGLIFRLRCPITGFPRPSVTWTRNDLDVKSSQRILIDKTNNDLIINGIEKSDTGQYVCSAVNPLGEARKSSFISIVDEKSVSISVSNAKLDTTTTFAPVTIKVGDSLTALSGTDVTIVCSVKGIPFPYVYWRRNGTRFKPEDFKGQFRIFQKNTVLKILQVSPEVAGDYECIASNVGGADRVSSAITVVASQSPSIDFGSERKESIEDLSKVETTVGSSVRMLAGAILSITCPSQGVPSPTFLWDFNGRQIKSQGRFQLVGNTLSIKETKPSDSGKYRCTATNIVASDRRFSDVNILAPFKPKIQGKPKNEEVLAAIPVSNDVGSRIISLEGASLQLRCSAQGLPKPKIQWKFEEIVVAGEILKLPNLDPGDTKNYTCEASNLAGVDRRTTSLIVKALEKPVIISSVGNVENLKRKQKIAVSIGKSVTVLKGAVLGLLCHAVGYPPPSISWTKDTVGIRRSREYSPFRRNVTHYGLAINTNFNRYFNGKYECVASNVGGSVSAASNVVVKAPTRPVVKSTKLVGSIGLIKSLESRDPLTITIGDNAQLLTGSQLTIKCPVSGLPVPTVTWFASGRRLTVGEKYAIVRSTDLIIGTARLPTTARDSLYYTCSATNYLGTDTAFSRIRFTEPKAPRILTFSGLFNYLKKRNIIMTIGAKITAVKESNITLKCEAVDGLPSPKITWLKNGAVLKQHNQRQYTIVKAKKSDGGNYQCRASNLAGTRVANSVLKIQDPPQKTRKPKIFTSNQSIIASENKISFNVIIGSNITILEGKNLVLQCPTTGLPTPEVTWLFNKKPVVRSETLLIDPDTGALTVVEMMKEETGIYRCKSKNIAGEDIAFTYAIVVGPKAPTISVSNKVYFRLDPQRKPIKIKIGDSLTTFKGTRVTIECPSAGFPDPRIRWNKNDISLAPQIPIFINGSMIILTNPEVLDSGKYTCLASNPGGSKDASSNITFLAPQKPKIITTPGDVEFLRRGSVTIRVGQNLKVLEGDTVTVLCYAKGIPKPTLSWRRNRRNLRISGNVLRLRNVRRFDTGRISCEARNYYGTDSRTSVITIIEGQKPKIKFSTKAINALKDLSKLSSMVGTSIRVLAGSRIRLSCSATGIPKPLYSWSVNRRAVVNSERIYFNKSTGVLDIKNVIPADSGPAQCTATNIIGTARSESSLNIIALRGPFIQSSKAYVNTVKSVKPVKIRVGTKASVLVNTTINIVCEVSGLPLPVTSWSFNGKAIKSGRLVVRGAQLTIPKAQMKDKGVYACTAKSAAGQLTVKSLIELDAGQKPSITSSDEVVSEHSDFSTTSATIGSSISVLSGAGLRLLCPVKGLPTPAVLWKINGRNIVPSQRFVVDKTKNTLTIPKLQTGNTKRVVTCTAVNPLGAESASSDVTVIGPIVPRVNSTKTSIVQLTNQNQVDSRIGSKITILEGTSVVLTCEATGLPKPEITWTLANIPVTPNGHVTIDGGVMKITKAGREDSGTYSCTATSLVGVDTAASVINVRELRGPFVDSSTKVLNLISSTRPIEMKIGSNLTALSTTNITIDCSVDGFPVPVTSWRKDGKIIIKDHVRVRGSKLIITRARFADGGVYICKARSVAGVVSVKSHLMVIAGQKPIISSSDDVESFLTGFTRLTSTIGSSISILAGSGLRITCPVRGIPKPVVTWNIKSRTAMNSKRLVFDKTQNSVTIPKLINGDFGKYTCIAKNILGETRVSSAVNVIEPFGPKIDKSKQTINVLDSEAPVTIRVGATARVLAGVSITINCKAVGLPYPNISWTLAGRPLKTRGHVTVDGDKLVILNGGSEDSGTYGCIAFSAMGKDTAATRLTIHSGEKARITTVGRKVSSLDGFVNISSYVGDNITALTGSDLTIFCPTEGLPEPLVTWNRKGRQLITDKRITVHPFTYTLRIKNLGIKDSGSFTCRARNTRGEDQKTSVLNIIVPFGPTLTTSTKSIDGLKYTTPISMTIGDNLTALVNATITIQCKAGGLPFPKTSWTRDGVKITSKGHVIIGKEALRIQKATLGDKGVYKCTASSDAGLVSASSVIQIKEPIPPSIKSSNKTIISLTRKPLGLVIGETVRTLTRIDFNITCEVEGLPTPEIIWRKNGVELPVDGRTFANGPIIYVADALTADTGFYVCEAKNVAGKQTVVSKLSIREPSAPEISAAEQRKLQKLLPITITTEIGSYIKTLEKSNITLTCDAKGFPTPTITWKKGVKTLTAARDKKNYTIPMATVADSGIYTCTAANLIGYDFRSSNVTIVAPKTPIIKTTSSTLKVLRREPVESVVGGSLTTLSENTIKLICKASGVPSPSLEWYKNNTKLNNKASVLIIASATRSDTGKYSCAASNLAGMMKVDTIITVLEGKAPTITTSKKIISELTSIRYIVAKVGGVVNTLLSSNVEIMCKTSGFPKPEITWYENGQEMLQNSPTHMVDSKTGTLLFVSLALRRTGTYKCVARNSLGTASASTVLNVQGLKHPFINSSRGIVTSLKSQKPVTIFIGHNLTVLSGTNVSVTCPSGGVPRPEVTWKREETELMAGGRVNVSRKVLSIAEVVEADSGRYACSAENVMGKILLASNLKVLDPMKPNILYRFNILKETENKPITTNIGTRVTSIPGNQLTLTCNVSGLPTPRITWKRNNLLAQEGGSSFIVPSLKESDSGVYTCVATNLAGVASEKSNVIVIAGSKPQIITPRANIIATEGENEVSVDAGSNLTTIVGTGVEIRCTVTGQPTPIITWLQNGSLVKITSVRFINKLNKALTLLGVTLDDNGIYTCFANNTFGQVLETTHLTIFDAERPSIRFSKRKIEDYERTDLEITIGDNLKAIVGSTVTIQCNATGNPPPEIQWFKSGALISSTFPIKAVNNTLKIYGAMWSDTGEYECLAVNAAGSDKKTSFIKFVPPEKPVIFQDPSVIEVYDRTPVSMTIGNTLKTLTQTPITINCTASGIPMPTYSWTKKGVPIVSSSDLEISLGGKQLSIRNLIQDDAGIYGCKATNKAGTDSASAPILLLEPILPRITSTDENITWYDRIPLSAPIGGKITALTGTQVTLTCKAIGFPEPAVTWKRDDEDSILETDGQYKLENRSLVIFAVQPSDSGSYKCFAKNLAGTVQSATNLKVIDPKEPVILTSKRIIRTEDRAPVTGTIGSRIIVIQGTPVSITCPVEGIPRPSISWSNGGRFLYPTNNNSRLVFANTTIANSGEYTCTAISPIGADAASSVLSVAAPVKPTITAPSVGKVIPLANKTRGSITIRDNITVFSGAVLDIKCSAIGLPKPKIFWKKKDELILKGVSVNGTLKVRIKGKSDAEVFTCIAMNSEGLDSATSTVIAIEPSFPRIQSRRGLINALDQPQTINATVGMKVKTLSATSVILQCPATGSPQPVINWSKTGQLIVLGDRITLTEDGSLVIRKSYTSDSGEYRCLARSVLGEDTAFSTVIIMNPARPSITSSTDYIIWYENRPFKSKIGNNLTTMKGRKLTLVCPAKGMPRPKITWYRGGERMRSEDNYVIKGNILIMWDLSVFDTDRYTCVAQNYAGSAAATSTLKVHDPVIPHIFKSRGSIDALSGYNPVNVTAGQDVISPTKSLVVLICPIKGVPRPKIIWIKDQEAVVSDNTIEVDCNGTLKFHGIRPTDAGEYICYVESFLGMDLALTHVKVIERSIPTIQKSNNVIPISDNGHVETTIGDNVTALIAQTIVIKCNATGIPYPRITWTRNGLKIQSIGMYSIDVKGTLTITGLTRDGVYTCSAQNDQGTDFATSQVTVKEPKSAKIISPRDPKTIPFTHNKNVTINVKDNVTALPNSTLTIKCASVGVPEPSVTWSKDGNAITSENKYHVSKDSSLVLKNVDEDDTGRYMCKAENSRGVDTASSLVTISKPTKPVIDRPIEPRNVPPTNDGHVTVSVGENVTAVNGAKIIINCLVDGDPTPTIVWSKDKLELKVEDGYILYENGTLEISSASSKDRGRYVCTARSAGGEDSESVNVMVVEQTKPRINRPDNARTILPHDGPVNATIGDNATVVTDSKLSINCPASGVPTPLYSWTKDGQQITIGTKYYLHSNGTLVITKVTVDEKGTYTCSVENIAGSVSETTNVDVVAPQKPMIKRPDKPSTKTPRDRNPVTMTIGDNVTALDNTSISIDCPSSGIPKPIITWMKDGEELSSEDGIVVFKNGTLQIARASLKDKGKYTCFAKNKNGQVNETSTVDVVNAEKPRINRPDKPRTIPPQDGGLVNATVGDNVTVLTDSNLSINCPATGLPKPTFTWSKDNEKISLGIKIFLLPNGTLIIKKVSVDDSGTYKCTVENIAGNTSEIIQVLAVAPQEPIISKPQKPTTIPPKDRRPVDMSVGNNVTSLTNTSIKITCSVTGIPKPTINWMKDGKVLMPSDEYVIFDNGTIVIRRASLEDKGRYTCVAKNKEGKDKSTSTIDVVSPEKPKITSPKEPETLVPKDRSQVNMTIGDNVTALTNTPISIDCTATGIPKPEITWRKDDQELTLGNGYVIHDNGTLVIEKASAGDRGRYTCILENLNGKVNSSSNVKVVDSKKPKISGPEKPRHVHPANRRPNNINVGENITALTNTKISIHCPATGTPKPKITWVKDGQTVREGGAIVILGNGTLVIKNTSPDERGRYTCTSKNIDGEDSKTSTVNVVESEASRISRPKNPRNITSEDGNPISLNVGNNINAIANSQISINCPVTGTPKPSIIWRENGFELVEREGFFIYKNGTLVIKKAKVKDKGQFTCVAENIAGKDSVTTNIKVLKPKAPKITGRDKPRSVSPKDGSPVNITIGDNVTALTDTSITIDCLSSAVPRAQVIWTKDGQELNSGSGYVIYENGSLLIVKASQEEKGVYKCTARNKNGEDSKTSIVNTVDPEKPKITSPKEPQTLVPKDRSQVNMTIGDNVTALTNTPISIDCTATGIPKPEITWSRNGQSIVKGDEFVIYENGTLLIKDAAKGDEGRYSCTSVNSNGEDSKSSVLRIVDSTKPSIVKSDPKNIPIGDGGPKTLNIGDSVTSISDTPITITCNATGIPNPDITWFKDGRKIGAEERARTFHNNTLLLFDVTSEQSGVYTCKARNIEGEDTLDSKVIILSPRKPSILKPKVSRNIGIGNEPSKKIKITDNVRSLVDKTISITCQSSGLPLPKMTWSKNGDVIRTGGDYEIDKNNTLILKNVKLRHSGTYTCTAKNVAGEDRASSIVTVIAFSKPSIQKPSISQNIQSYSNDPVAMAVGNNVTTFSKTPITLTCNASGIPKPRITWLKDGRSVTPGERTVIDQKGRLVLRRVLTDDSGRYTCVAVNLAGRDTMDSFVDIFTPQSPSIAVAQIKQEVDLESPVSVDVGADVTALVDTTISMHCKASGTPEPTVFWIKDGQRVKPGEFYEILKNNTLVIRQAKEDDGGEFVCTARNVLGEDKKSSTVTVIEAEIPVIQRTNGDFESSEMKPVDVKVGRYVTSLSRVNIKLNCSARGVPSPRIKWMNGGKMLDVTGPTLSLKNVSSSDSGTYTCLASNVAGKVNASTFINITEPIRPVIQKARSEFILHKVTSVSTSIGKSIEILTGSTLLLLCNVTGHPQPKITWSKFGLPIANRDRYVINGAALRIFGVQTTDTSEITCTAKNLVGEAVASSELLIKGLLRPEINAVKKLIKNFDKTKPIRVPIGTKLITTLSTTIVVRCQTSARPRAVLSWQRNGEAIVANEKYKLNGDKSELTIQDIQFSDEGTYVCNAFNRAGTDFDSMDITVATPPVITNIRGSFEVTDIRDLISITTGAVVTIPKGVSIKIKCQASGVPNPNITWYRVAEGSKNWQPIGKANERLYVDKDSFLSIERSKEVDIARYICVAQNVAGRDEGITYLNVGAVPDIPGHWAAARKFTRPSVKRIETMATVIRGSTLRLRCTVYGSPKPDVTWYVVGNENRDRWKIFPDGTLQIKKVDFSDEGNYTCIGKNEYGTTYRSTNVTVLVPPRILKKFFSEAYLKSRAELLYVKYSSITKLAIKRQQTRSTAVEKGGNLIIGCPVRGRPDPTILWLKNGLKVRNDSKHLVLDGVLMIRNISEMENGEYFCFVRNTAGEDGGGLDLHVRDKIIGSWKVTKWSECHQCYGNFLGYSNRTVDCMDDRNNTVPESYCDPVPAPPTRQNCRTRSCEAIWITGSWSPCSALCGGNGTKTRSVQCVFYKSLLPAKRLCNPSEKPISSEPCNRAPCGQRICKDKVNYCKQIKDRNLCTAYRAWCCKTCGRW